MPLRLMYLALLAAACAPTPESEPSDVDGDGLDAAFEGQVGTSDQQADSDGDGCSDALEVLGYFDPLDPTDRPYTGGYPRGPRAPASVFDALAEAHGEAFEVGQLNPDWHLVDQHGELVQLRDFYGQVILVDLAAEWCVPCQQATPVLDSNYNELKEEGFVVLQLLLEGVRNNSEPQAERWAEELGASFPVLADYSPGDYTLTEVAQYYLDVPGASYEIPNYSLIDREQVVRELYVYERSPSIEEVRPLLDTPAPELEVLLPDNAEELRAELGLTPGSWVTPASLCEAGG